jgi:hypothetical protein
MQTARRKEIQWALESRTQSFPRCGSTFNVFDFRVKWHELHDVVECRAHGSTSEFLFEFQTEFFSNFLFEFQVVRESNLSTFEGPLYYDLRIVRVQNGTIRF